ncbi:MAG TPA: hypothetical protein VMT22_11290 [Terriglobales bacterium]|nr:hypothetical protein [Terriglobales bacterium]
MRPATESRDAKPARHKFAKTTGGALKWCSFDQLKIGDFSVAATRNQRIPMISLPIFNRMIVAVTVALLQGCASVQQISPQSVEDKVARIKLGVTTMSEVENVLGTQHGSEDRRWFYNLSDTAMQITERKTGPFSGAIPVAPATVATNTRAMITVGFGHDGKVAALEVARFFDPPFRNDYWYRIKEEAPKVLEFVRSAGEFNDFRVADGEKSAGTLALEDSSSNARVTAQLENHTLHITSNNPHDRLTTEYRLFTRRERAFINKISTADFIW